VGRIDEALGRAGVSGEAETPSTAVEVFKPAWAVSEQPDPAPAASLERAPALPIATATPDYTLVHLSSRWKERLAAGPDSDIGLVEQYRRLAATLHHSQQRIGTRSLMLTSASPGDGKTLTALNLALVLAGSYRAKVLLVDADLRRPSMPNVTAETDGCGLSEALIGSSDRKLALIPIAPGLTLLPAGPPVANSIEALTSPRMQQILAEATTRFDWVILDAPPVGPATDARLLAQMVGTTLFVIHAGKTQCPDVQQAIAAIGKEQILGIVLNGVESMGSQPYYYGVA
jgi:capsular exopolysaccharide synthesis family protein